MSSTVNCVLSGVHGALTPTMGNFWSLALHVGGKSRTTSSGDMEVGACVEWTFRPGNPGYRCGEPML